jgi:cephalosporin-C deacetylase-like acetyl esterase
MIRAIAGAVVLMLGATAIAGPPTTPAFDYDRKTPQKIGIGSARPMTVGVYAEDITFESGDRRITGEFVPGLGRGPHPAILFVHWLGDPKTTNHTEFEPDAIAFAKRGVSSLLVDAPWSHRGWFGQQGASADADIASSRDEVIDLRRSLDLLQSLPGVDRSRLAYVGHDFGAMFGVMVASVDARARWWVFMAPNSSLGEWYLWEKKIADRDVYLARLSVFDLANFAPKLSANGVLFQFSQHDAYVTREHAQAIFQAIGARPKAMIWFDTDHALATDEARENRVRWLTDRLLAKP